MRKALLSLALLAGSFIAHSQALPGLLLNEVSQGRTSTQEEYFEFVVAGNRTCTDSTLDLRGWIFDDNNGWIASGVGTGIATGAMRFANVASWSKVPYGSIIVVYNDADKNGSITLPDDPTDANHDYVYVLKASSPLFEKNITDPFSPSSASFTYPTTGWTTGGDWATLSLANGGDGIVIVKPTTLNDEYFSFGFAIGSASTATVWVTDMPGGKNWWLSDGQYNNASSWVQGDARSLPGTPGNETPGAANAVTNFSWINGMRVQAVGPDAGTVTGGPTVCVGGTTTYSSTGVAGGLWSVAPTSVATINATTGVATGVAAGNATVTYTVTSGGCTSTATAPLTVLSTANAGTVSGPSSLCVGATGNFTTTGTPGGIWSTSNTAIATVNPATGLVTGVSGGGPVNVIYSIGSGSCAATASAPLTVTAPPALQPTTGPSSLCVGATIQLTNPFQPNGAGTWTASPAGLVTLTPTAPAGGPHIVLVTAVAPGVATITLTAGIAGCTSSVPFTLTIHPVPVVGPVLGGGNLCSGTTTTLANATPGGTWSSASPAVATVNPTTGVVTGIATGSSVVTYTVTGTGSCTASTNTTINVQSTPNPGPNTGVSTLCVGATSTFTNALPGGTWSSTNATIASVNPTTGVVTGVAAGGPVSITYTVTTNGCTGTSNTTLNVTAAPVIAPIANFALCPGGTTTITPSSAGGTWSSANTGVATVTNAGVVNGISAGSSVLTYTLSSGGCTATRDVTVTVANASVQLNASATTITAGQNVTLTPAWSGTAPFAVSAWTPAALFPNQTAATQTIAPAATTTFSVTGSDANGCPATGSVTVTVTQPLTDDLFVPNFFSPNADGRNDVLYFYGSSVTALEFRIFNQWGETVFSSTDKSRGWDGTAGGKAQPVGVYMYVAKATLANGQTRTLKGSINLIR